MLVVIDVNTCKAPAFDRLSFTRIWSHPLACKNGQVYNRGSFCTEHTPASVFTELCLSILGERGKRYHRHSRFTAWKFEPIRHSTLSYWAWHSYVIGIRKYQVDFRSVRLHGTRWTGETKEHTWTLKSWTTTLLFTDALFIANFYQVFSNDLIKSRNSFLKFS